MRCPRNLILVVVIGIMAISALVVIAQTGTTTDVSNLVTVSVNAPLSGTTAVPVAVLAGNQFTIVLPSNQTTGYSWRMASQLNNNVVRQLGNRYVEPSEGMIGRGGTELWTFKAVGKGTQTISMEYVRPWEQNAQPAKKRTFSVTVQ